MGGLDGLTNDDEDEAMPDAGPDEVTMAFRKLEIEAIEEFEDLEIDGYPNEDYTKIGLS
ncbi:hypothetical protein F5Y04DRAFT_277690 [Hypomontagnella monticulosa]|nr:hypothetical protein F5Y04DRAFT_277690 [Hypomontagnella monticulosa]